MYPQAVNIPQTPRHSYCFPFFEKVLVDTSALSTDPKKTMHVICHELLHYFQPSQLPYLIKESIPVILNHPSFKLETSDAGLNDPETKYYRNMVWDIYCKGKTYSTFLEAVKAKPYCKKIT